MLKREPIKESNQVKVTFVVPHNADQPRISVVGDFNNWDPSATPLVKRANNTRSASVKLDANQRYRFRYYMGDNQWFNDEAADAYEPNPHGSDDCILLT